MKYAILIEDNPKLLADAERKLGDAGYIVRKPRDLSTLLEGKIVSQGYRPIVENEWKPMLQGIHKTDEVRVVVDFRFEEKYTGTKVPYTGIDIIMSMGASKADPNDDTLDAISTAIAVTSLEGIDGNVAFVDQALITVGRCKKEAEETGMSYGEFLLDTFRLYDAGKLEQKNKF
ncbi:hypothetical protein HOK51_10280 [Candidatus Woesearchaeota archaeon]|jgi:hypothetical protein|nr:hypothetical protein [Candidatus Woesearchaeota archaeon]MBT6520211.1 hypothetical protein [Candidatus Woesearchaeota archaeon]MBT7367222.1 hypothetical protein [Candidatus Woesearchaeota archaeon]